MAQSTFKINQSFYDKIESVKKNVNARVRDRLEEIANYIVSISPNYSGAYLLSHSVKANNTRGRGRSRISQKKPAVVGNESNRSQALNQLLSDIQAIDVESLEKVTFRNDSPHARKVEDNPPELEPQWTRMKGPEQYGSYGVYRRTKARFR